MATVTFIKYAKQSAGALGGVAAYVAQANKTMQENGQHLVSGQNCTPSLAVREFLTTRAMHRKESPVWFYHYVQSFAPNEPVTGELAHELAKMFAARAWPESEVLIATHIDREHIHSHFIVNSVCFGNGKMLRQGPGTLARLRPISDELCAAHGLSVLPRQEAKTQGLGAREYRSATKGESWKFRLMNTIDACMKYAADKDAFVSLMESEGYAVCWESSRKYITYTTPDGMKCRDNKLHEEKYCKEAMEHEFRIRAEIVSARTQAAQHPADSAAGAGTTSRSTSHKSGLGANDEIHGCTVSPCGSAARSVGERQQADVAASHADAAGRSAESGAASGADDRTGWEAEREFFFSAQNQTSQTASATCQYSGIDLSVNGGGSTASALVGLGHRLEQLRPAEPVIPARHHTDRKALQKEREKKFALGHKADDHEDEVSYDWQQTM
mgnify:CR=1 FL=1